MSGTGPGAPLYERLKAAREILGVAEEATIGEIKSAFRDRIRRWHPDKAGEDDVHVRMSNEITAAYQTIMSYCRDYKISFSRETVQRYRSEEEFWWERFGNDPMWGPGG